MPGLKDKHIIRIWNGLFFVALLVFWRFFYVNHLVQKEQMQLFLLTFDYLKQHLAFQGGLAIYLGEFITQFFLNKWLAAVLVSSVLLLLSLGVQKVLTYVSDKCIFLLSWIPAIAYHFMLFNPYYKLAGLVALTFSVGSVILFLQIKNAKQRTALGFVLLPINYWFLGGAVFLFTLSAIFIELQIKYSQKKDHEAVHSYFTIIAYLAILLIIPYLNRQFLLTDHLLSAYFSRVFYQFSFLLPAPVILILVSLPALLFFYGWLPKKRSNILHGSIGVLLFTTLILGSKLFPDFAEENEMGYDNLVRLEKWEEIIRQAEQEIPDRKQGKEALSLALSRTGQMSTLLFHFNPGPNDFFIPFNIQGQAPMIASEPYFYLGLINFSKMLCVETTESTPDETRPVRMMQRLAEDYLITGEYEVAGRYLWYLERTLFYRQWAKESRKYLFDDQKVEAHPLWGKLRKQQVHDDFYYQYERNDAALISLLRSDPHNKIAYEYLMSWYLLRKDFDSFLKYLPLVNTMDYNGFPVVFQEAVAYVKTLFGVVPEGLDQYPISAEVQQRFNRYAQAFQQGGSSQPAEMKKLFGNTYW